jgi:hypothetical protein
MNKSEIVEKLNNAGIYQLRKGESVADALDSIENGTARIGYEFKHSNGTPMSQNAIISASNKEAFAKSVQVPERMDHGDVDIEDITGEDDFRDDLTKVGEIQECQYCSKPLRVDEGATFDIINCSDCHSYAVYQNCM